MKFRGLALNQALPLVRTKRPRAYPIELFWHQLLAIEVRLRGCTSLDGALVRRMYNMDPSKPLLLAIKGRVLDVRNGVEYYGPDGPYKIMAGCDASKAFAMMSLKAEDAHDDLTGVDDTHLGILDDWYKKLSEKYPTCGRLVKPIADDAKSQTR